MGGPPILRDARGSKIVGDVYAIWEISIRLFNLRPPSPRMPHNEWKIPFPSGGVYNYDYYPSADIIAFAELQEKTCVYFVIEIVATS